MDVLESTLNTMISDTEDESAVRACVQLMNIYVKNIVENPDNPKYRKIRISNAKFHSVIWSFEKARMLLLFAGFEEENDSLVLPIGVNLVNFQRLLKQTLESFGTKTTEPETGSSNLNRNSTHVSTPQTLPHLKLGAAAATGSSMFDTDVKPDMTLLSYLTEMGYRQDMAQKALIKTRNKGVQPAMDWIDAHLEELLSSEATNKSTSNSSIVSDNHQEPVAGSLDGSPVKEGDHVKAPTSRYQKVADQKHQYQEKQRQEAIAAAREAKKADKKHKEYLLKNLQAERNLANEKFERQKIARQDVSSANEAQSTAACETSTAASRDYYASNNPGDDACARIRVRLISGNDFNVDMGCSQHIKDLYQRIAEMTSMETNEFILSIPVPPTELTDMEATVGETGLFPSATLMMKLKNSERKPFEEHEDISKEDTLPQVDSE